MWDAYFCMGVVFKMGAYYLLYVLSDLQLKLE